MHSVLSAIILCRYFWYYLRKKNFVKVNTLYFCQGTLDPCRAIIVLDFAFSQEIRSLAMFVTAHMGPENIKNLHVLVEKMLLQNWLFHHRNLPVCWGFFITQFVSCQDHPWDNQEDLVPFVTNLLLSFLLSRKNFALFWFPSLMVLLEQLLVSQKDKDCES